MYLRAAQGHTAGRDREGCRLPTGPAQARFRLPPGTAQPSSPLPPPLALRRPQRAASAYSKSHLGDGPEVPFPGRPPPPTPAGGGREASPPALQASLPQRPESRLRPVRRIRLRTHRRGDSLPQPAGPGQAHVRLRLPSRRYAAMAAETELGDPTPSLPGLRSPRGGGDFPRPYPSRGAELGTQREPGDQPLPCRLCGARPSRVRWGPAPAVDLLRSRVWCEEGEGEQDRSS